MTQSAERLPGRFFAALFNSLKFGLSLAQMFGSVVGRTKLQTRFAVHAVPVYPSSSWSLRGASDQPLGLKNLTCNVGVHGSPH